MSKQSTYGGFKRFELHYYCKFWALALRNTLVILSIVKASSRERLPLFWFAKCLVFGRFGIGWRNHLSLRLCSDHSRRSVNMFFIVSSECFICFRQWCVRFRSRYVVIGCRCCCNSNDVVVTIVSMFTIRRQIGLLVRNYVMSSHYLWWVMSSIQCLYSIDYIVNWIDRCVLHCIQ